MGKIWGKMGGRTSLLERVVSPVLLPEPPMAVGIYCLKLAGNARCFPYSILQGVTVMKE